MTPPATAQQAAREIALPSVLNTAPAAGDPALELHSPLDPYAAIVAFAERELALARDGRIEDLRSMAPEWDLLTADLPPQPPASARGALERAAALHERTSATLMSLREAMLCDLRTAARASRAAHGYAGQNRRRARRFDESA
jgi:hypothetical protein